MSWDVLKPDEFARLRDVANLLMPETGKLPAAGSIADFDRLVASAIDAASIAPDEVVSAIAALPQPIDWHSLQSFAMSEPKYFETLALIASGAYAMAPELLNRLGFPADRRNPAGPMDAADEYETGILEPVVNRGRVFRNPR